MDIISFFVALYCRVNHFYLLIITYAPSILVSTTRILTTSISFSGATLSNMVENLTLKKNNFIMRLIIGKSGVNVSQKCLIILSLNYLSVCLHSKLTTMSKSDALVLKKFTRHALEHSLRGLK